MGDTQRTLWVEFWREQNDAVRPHIFSRICDSRPSALIHLGDAVADGASDSDWMIYDSLSRCINIASIPVFGVMGNHDYFGSNDACIRNATKRFTNLQGQRWSCCVMDSVAYILLNSNFDELTDDEIQWQSGWLDSVVRSVNMRDDVLLAVACWHHPPYTNSSVVGDDKEVQRHLLQPLRQCTKLRMIASGHAHTYEHFNIDGLHFLVSGGGGGARQELLPVEKARHRSIPSQRVSGNRICKFHYCTVQRKGMLLNIEMHAFDEHSMTWAVDDSWHTD